MSSRPTSATARMSVQASTQRVNWRGCCRPRRRSTAPGTWPPGPGNGAWWPPASGPRRRWRPSRRPLWTRARWTVRAARSSDRLLRGDQFVDRGLVDVDEIGGAAVFAGKPVVGEVQIDAGRLDGAVTGLGLDRFQGHAGLAEPGQAGVAQLVAGAALE